MSKITEEYFNMTPPEKISCNIKRAETNRQ